MKYRSPLTTVFLAVLTWLLAISLARAVPQVIISDDLNGNWTSILGTTPETSLPGANWQLATGWSFNQSLVPSDGGRWNASNGTAAAVSLASAGSYTKPTAMTISAEVYINTPSGSNTPWVVLGFYDALTSSSGSTLNSLTNFTGLALSHTGALSLYNDGALVSGSTVAYGGSFATATYYTLSYTVDTATGAISAVSLSGSSANYATLTSAGAPFTGAKTAYAGIGGAADSPTSARGGTRFRNFLVTSAETEVQDIVVDSFDLVTSNGSVVYVPGTTPNTANLPGATWQETRGWNWAEPLIHDSAGSSPTNTARMINNTGIAISLASSGSYTKPDSLSISADVAVTGGNTGVGAVYLGFYATPPPPNANSGNALSTFSGLKLTENGSVTLVQNGTESTSITGPAISRGVFYELSFDVDTATGAISNVSREGSSSSYTFSSSAFTASATAYAAFVVNGGQNATGAVDNFAVRGAGGGGSPPASTISPFGLSQNASISGYANWMDDLADAGVKSFRYFHEWGGIEPTNNSYNYSGPDAFVGSAESNGIEIAGVLAYSPSWTSSSHHEFPIDNLADWAEYVGNVVGRYDGADQPAVTYWEVWNEPNATAFNTGNRPASDYAALIKSAYTAAKTANPDCMIGLTIANYDVRYITQVIDSLASQGAAGNFDFIAVHPYELVGRMNAPDGELQYLAIVSNLRKMLAVHAPTKVDVPIRFTELGARIGDSLQGEVCDAQLSAELLVKAYTLGIVQGAEQINWFEAKDPTSTTSSGAYGFGVMDVNLNKRAGWYAYQAMTDSMGANPTYTGWLALGSSQTGYGLVFGGGPSNSMAAWMPKGESATVSFGATVQVVDIYTNTTTNASSITLTDKPVMIRNLPASMVTQAAANKSQPYPWGSDSVNANLAEIQLGADTLASGVELDRANTVTPNGSGTNGVIVNQVGNAMYLSVNPAFADFDTDDVYIRVTAHQTALRTSGYSGMNLFYQPTTGNANAAPQYPYKNFGAWKGLANNLNSQSFTWHVTDGMFVNTFGHGIYLQFDASVPFVIDKVEVSKVPF